jgi:hypothetical protein
MIECEEETDFKLGKAVLIRNEIARISMKIEEALAEFQLYTSQDASAFFFLEKGDISQDESASDDNEGSDVEHSADSTTDDDGISEVEESSTSDEEESSDETE